ncbi:MAG TPA: 5-deoxy-glucuronate isomerase, partial [Anaerolineaceae bacterium]
MQYTASSLLLHPHRPPQDGLINGVEPAQAGWEKIHFAARQLAAGQTWSFAPGRFEIALVVLSGTLRAASNRGEWPRIGRRASVFAGLPEALYLPGESTLEVEAEGDCQFAVAWAPAVNEHPARFIPAEEVTVELRGGDNVSRHINGIIRPGFDCD